MAFKEKKFLIFFDHKWNSYKKFYIKFILFLIFSLHRQVWQYQKYPILVFFG